MTLQELTAYFNISRRISNTSYQCKCPAHKDSKASLTISEDKGKLLLRCHAGCDTKDILGAVGLSFKDLGNYQPPKWRERLEYGQKKRIESVYDYKEANGKYLYSKVRFEGKVIRYVTVDEVNDTYQYYKNRDKATLYRLPELLKAIKDGYPVYIVEGEKDVETLRKLGYTATTAGGVNDWKKEYAAYFTGANVIILPDNDEPGMNLKNQIVRDLKHYAHTIRWTTTSTSDKGDVTDYLQKEGHKKEDLKQLVAAAETIYAPWIHFSGNGESKKIHINGGILADSISRGLSYLIVRRPDDDKDDFYLYENGVYNKCNRNKVKSIIHRYIPVNLVSDNMVNNVYNLLLCQERNICSFHDLDKNEKYINLKNGLYNISTRQLEPHTPKLYSTIQLACEYHPESGSRIVFERYMNDLCKDRNGNVDEEKKAVLQEYIGILLSNVNVHRTKLCLVLWSIMGNSGKTQLLNLIGRMLGTDKTANLPIQKMNEQSKFSVGNIVGKRAIIVGDQSGSEVKDSSLFKQITGGDTISCERKGKQPYDFCFPGGIIIACNNLPTFTDDKGGHLFERLCVVPCMNIIEKERRDGAILDKMLKEQDAIFNWFLEGLHRLIDNNYKVTKSEACENAVNEYREKMDTVYRYISEFYIITGNKEDMVSKPKFEEDYIKWCEENDYTNVKKQNIKDRMEANGCPASKANLGDKRGVNVYRNIKQKENEFGDVTEDEELPFT